jgi:uncharacterized membrane protein YebE (DUF533 family)
MDILITIALVYLAYRGYQWYTNIQKQVNGPKRPREVREDDFANTPQPGNEDDYIDYEEVK